MYRRSSVLVQHQAKMEVRTVPTKIPSVIEFGYKDFFYCDSARQKWVATCKFCSPRKDLREASGTTSTYIRHLQRKHPTEYEQYLALNRNPETGKNQRTLTGMGVCTVKYGPNHPDQQRKVLALVKDAIIGCGLPISIVERPEFLAFLEQWDNRVSVPSGHSITRTILPKISAEKTRKTIEALKQAKAVALTMDIWTDRRLHAFLGVTAHTFHEASHGSYLIAFKVFKGSHTGDLIADAFESVLTDNGLENKISYVVTDNATNMKKALFLLNERKLVEPDSEEGILSSKDTLVDEDLWQDLDEVDQNRIASVIEARSIEKIPCFAHTLQLVVRDGLEVMGSTPVVNKACQLSNILHRSSSVKSSFESIMGQGKLIPVANSTRWNSLFKQLRAVSSLDNRKYLQITTENHLSHLAFTPREWEVLQELVRILEPFNEVTDLVQGESYSTISCVVPSILALLKKLTTYGYDRPKYHSSLTKALLESLKSRFGGLLNCLQVPGNYNGDNFGNFIFPMATVLDPTYGFLWLDEHPGSEDQKTALKSRLINLICERGQTVLLSETREVSILSDEVLLSSHSDTESTTRKRKAESSLFSFYAKKKSTILSSAKAEDKPLKAQIYEYLCKVETYDDLASAIKENQSLLPLFERIFSVPATSAPVERVFSKSGILMRPHRAQMSDDTLTMLMLASVNK